MPQNTKFFLDSCDPTETAQTLQILGKLDGQTTNPTLLTKNPFVQVRTKEGKIPETELLEIYRKSVTEISTLIPAGSVSIEVYADSDSTVEQLLTQANEFYQWIPNAHIKFPTTTVGLEAAEAFVNSGGRVNLTLVFSQEQALAVHLATKNCKIPGGVFVSPFIGRLDDTGLDGISLVENIRQMYSEISSHVQILAASVRSLDHLGRLLDKDNNQELCDIITAPLSLWNEYANVELVNLEITKSTLTKIDYKELDYDQKWHQLDIRHELTDKGLNKFASDWNVVVEKS